MTSATDRIRARLRPLHVPPAHPARHNLAAVTHVALVIVCIAAWIHGAWPVSVALWIAIAWMNHAALSRLHEAAHRMLFRSRGLNELSGVIIGTLALIPLSVYRYVHNQHHQHLGRERDPEFWPYNLPASPRSQRLLYAWLELLAGCVFTPVLYSLRTARAWPSLALRPRRRLVVEWLLMAVVWSAVLLAVGFTDTWTWLLVGHVAPAWIAGSFQTIRKFTEHLGRFGETPLDMTRTVVYSRRAGQLASASQLHVDHHGTHHLWPGIPFHKLPEATPIVHQQRDPGCIYTSHWAAIRDMLPHLADPRVGPQWKQLDGVGSGVAAK